MTHQSGKTIRADEARRKFRVEGDRIVWAVLDTGIHRDHVHFAKHQNLILPPPLHHADFSAPELPEDLHEQEALVDLLGYGTFTAGIICGESFDAAAGQPHVGIAPKCKVVSIKIFDENSATSEYHVLAALEWIRSTNRRHAKPLIHGLIMHAGLQQDVRNYACGQTPVCEAVNEVVRSGTVVVVPAGNNGYRADGNTPQAIFFASITDPGNAELAITVGSTHRTLPREYGASYFSSRGPTMDGRLKPDILAPGEKVTSCWIEPAPSSSRRSATTPAEPAPASYQCLDGTFIAAAHVSGAVALLLSARPQLIGGPLEVKQLLMKTATDLKRVPWVQGSGLIDAFALIAEARKPVKSTRAAAARRAPAPARHPDSQPTAGSTEKVGLAEAVTPDAPRAPGMVAEGGKRFVFGISYPGTHRKLISDVVYKLRPTAKLKREQILFDLFHEAEFARPDLGKYLPRLYETQCELVVVFLGGDYRKSKWCGLEWEVIREVIKRGGGDNIMPLRLDLEDIPGLQWTDGYMDVSDRDPEEIAAKILERLELNRAAGR
jgi:serine protease AprX